MNVKLMAFGVLLAAAAMPSGATCFTVFNGSTVVYRSTSSPVDLSERLSVTVPAQFGLNTFMTMSNDDADCGGGRIGSTVGAPVGGLPVAAVTTRQLPKRTPGRLTPANAGP